MLATQNVRAKSPVRLTPRLAAPARKLHRDLREPTLQRVIDGGTPISKGAKGAGVQRVQAALERLRISVGGADGEFGANTEKGLLRYQRKGKVPETGTIDADTLARLSKSLARADRKDKVGPTGTGPLKNSRFLGDKQLDQVLQGKTVLGAGSKGSGLKRVQQGLVDMGFALHGGADGAYGAQSQKALTNFQKHAASKFTDVKATGKLDAPTLRALDALAPAPGKKGQKGNVPRPFMNGKQVRVVVAMNEHRTFLYDRKGRLTNIFPNAVGAPGTNTASGLKVVAGKLDAAAAAATGRQLWNDPTVFGTRMLNLSWADGRSSGEELHGTNAPQRLGEDVSHGCMRHDNKDIIAMYNAVSVGDRVGVVNNVRELRG